MARSSNPPPALSASGLRERLTLGVPSVVVLAGSERFFREDGLRQVVGIVLPEGDPGSSFHRYDARRNDHRESVSAAVDELKTVSLFGGDKVVAIDNPESASGPWAAVARTSPLAVLAKAYLEAPVEGSVLVLLTPKPVKGKGAVPSRTLAKAGALVVDCRALYDAPGPWQRGAAPHDHELAKFLSRRMHELHGKRIAPPEAHALTLLVGSDLSELHGALRALALYVGDRPSIAVDDVHAVVADTRSDPAWKLVDAVFGGDVAEATQLLAAALARGLPDGRGGTLVRGEGVFAYLGAALLAQYRKVLAGAERLAEGEAPGEVARSLGIPSFRAEAFLERCRQDPAALFDRGAAFYEAERGVKGGRVPAPLALERLVLALAGA